MDEFNFINKVKPKYIHQHTLIKGIGDDAAVFKQEGESIVTAVDTFVEGVHFIKNKTIATKDIGYRCLAANISDIAAMGAIPKFYLVSVVIPSDWKEADVLDVFKGFNELGEKYKMDLIGGDTVSGDTFVLSVTVIGYADKDKIRYRSAAEVDDVVFVTGTIGNSAVGLDVLLNNLDIKNKEYFIQRHQIPEPRIDFIKAIKEINRVCLNDTSDGLSNELNEIAKSSNVSIMIKDEFIPIEKELKMFSEKELRKLKYSSGEDFELVGTTSKMNWLRMKEIAKKNKFKVTKIGHVIKSENNNVYLNTPTQVLKSSGYIHLK